VSDLGGHRPRLAGQVAAFDEAAGLGEVTAAGKRYQFHCTQIADGSRTIPAGVAVTFRLLAGRGGRWEASDLRTVGTVEGGAGEAAPAGFSAT
jgi:cold shock CspA family protein